MSIDGWGDPGHDCASCGARPGYCTCEAEEEPREELCGNCRRVLKDDDVDLCRACVLRHAMDWGAL